MAVSVEEPLSLASIIQFSKFLAIINPSVRSEAERTAESRVTTSRQSLPYHHSDDASHLSFQAF